MRVRCLRLFESPIVWKRRSFSSFVATHSLALLHDVLLTEDEDLILPLLDALLAKKKYEGNHWDDAIVRYKEVYLEMHLDRAANGQYGSEGVFAKKKVSLVQFKLDNCSALLRNALTREPFNLSIEDTQEMLLQSAHVIDLAEDGWIGPHVDSIKFSGDMIAGFSLLSSRTMKMTLLPKEEIQFPTNYNMDINEYWQQFPYETHIKEKGLVLPPRSMYIMSGIWRYGYQHAILPSPGHRRLSIIFRNELPGGIFSGSSKRK